MYILHKLLIVLNHKNLQFFTFSRKNVSKLLSLVKDPNNVKMLETYRFDIQIHKTEVNVLIHLELM